MTTKEIDWKALEDSVGQLSSLTSTQGVLNLSLVLYLKFATQVVIGVPDEFEMFGLKISINEILFAFFVSLLINSWIIRNLYFIDKCIKEEIVERELAIKYVSRRHTLFNPFLFENTKWGFGSNLMISIVSFIIHNIVISFISLTIIESLLSEFSFENILLTTLGMIPLILVYLEDKLIHRIDSQIINKKRAIYNSIMRIGFLIVVSVLITFVWNEG